MDLSEAELPSSHRLPVVASWQTYPIVFAIMKYWFLISTIGLCCIDMVSVQRIL